jgi:5-methylcytosine-specific restriction enzyme A
MGNAIPDGISREDLLSAIRDFDAGAPHAFGASTVYDLLFEGRRYPPKAIVGLAAERHLGRPLQTTEFRGGLGTKCFRVLEGCGFEVVRKVDPITYPDEIEGVTFIEGLVTTVTVNRYERDPDARTACIDHYGARCRACGLVFSERYGDVGDGFIHVHHLTPLSEIRAAYALNPIRDLRPVCPNCHAMLHRRTPPFSIEELQVKLGIINVASTC